MPRKGLTPEIVVDAAIRLIDAGGPESLTLAAIAESLDVRPPSLFNHVAGLPELRRLLHLRGLREMSDRVMRAAVGRSGGDAILAAADAIRAFAREHPGLYAASLAAPPVTDAELVAAGERFTDIFFDVVRQYGFEGDEAVHAVRGLFSTIHGFIMLERAGTFAMPVDPDKSFRRLIARYIDSLDDRVSEADRRRADGD